MTTRHACQGEPRSARKAVGRQGLHRVHRARRMKPARPAGKRTEQKLIPAHERHAKAHGPRHQRLPISAQLAQGSLKICGERGKGRIVRLATRNGNDVERRPRAARLGRPAPEHLSQPTLGTIADDRAPQPTRRDDAQPIAPTGVGARQQRDKSCRDPSAVRLHRGELPTMTQTRMRPKRFGQLQGLGRNRQALSPFSATPLKHRAAILGAHTDKKTVRAATPAAIGLEGTLHEARTLLPAVGESSIVANLKKAVNHRSEGSVCQARTPVVNSPAFRNGPPTGRQVFHICGKTCGNRRVLAMRPVNPTVNEGFMTELGGYPASFRR
jgi:hypothetical protein